MPRSKSPRKHKTHRKEFKHRKHYDYEEDRVTSSRSYSKSKSRSRSRSRSKSSRRHHRHYRDDHDYYRRDDRRNGRYRRYSRSSRRRRSSDRKPKKHSRKYYKDERRHKGHKHHKYYDRSDESESSSYDKCYSKKKDDSEDAKDRSKDADHYKHREGNIIADRYKIVKHLGDGTFGRVLEIEDLNNKKRYAMKVIRAVKRYVESAQVEASILFDIKKQDPEDRYGIVRLENAFLKDPSHPSKEQNYFMIFERLGKSLYDFLKMNKYQGFSIEKIQSFARQTLRSIGFMHSIGLTHTDLKPENILLVRDDYYTINKQPQDQAVDDRSSTSSRSDGKKYHIPKYDEIKIIDMGGATYDYDHHSSIINTRQYRAPEVMLACCPWDHASDVWSIACILLELFSGDLFFSTHNTLEHLGMIDKVCGSIPFWMANRAESKLKKLFVLDSERFTKYGTYFEFQSNLDRESITRINSMKSINDTIPSKYPEFRDLLTKMLVIDPKLRIKCSDALEHPFFKVNYNSEDKKE